MKAASGADLLHARARFACTALVIARAARQAWAPEVRSAGWGGGGWGASL